MKRRIVITFIQGVVLITMVIFTLGGTSIEVEANSKNSLDSICDGTIKVMPLGDSITTGKYSGHDTSDDPGAEADDISYRYALWNLLTDNGYSVDFVGTESNGSTYPFSDPQHEGHNGWTDSLIALNIYNNGGANWLNINPPDVILLHIGTNNLNPDPSDVEDILDEIDEYEGDTGLSVIVIVARIINRVPLSPTVTQFNDNVEAMVVDRADPNIVMVDMDDEALLNYSIYPGDPNGDMIDPLHPYETGYNKMAGVWYQKFDEIADVACVTNDPPNVTNPGTQTDSEGDSINLPIEATDPDGDDLAFGATGLPPNLSINSGTGIISGTIGDTASLNSPYEVQVTVSDGKPLGTKTVNFNWSVAKTNQPPTIQNPGDQSAAEGDSISLQITATDIHNDTLTYSADNLPPGLSIDQGNGLISGILSYDASNNSPYSVEVMVEDDGDPPKSDIASFTWTVANTNRAPVVSTPLDQSNNEGDTIAPPLQIVASDPDGDNLTYEADNLPPGLSIDGDSGIISGTIPYDAVGDNDWMNFDVTITVTDDDILPKNTEVQFTWHVENVNGAPELVNPGTIINHIGDQVSVQIEASDPDGDSLTFSAEGLPPNLNINPNSGLISGVLPDWAAIESPYLVRLTVIDDGYPHKDASVTFSWIVKEIKFEIFLPVIIH